MWLALKHTEVNQDKGTPEQRVTKRKHPASTEHTQHMILLISMHRDGGYVREGDWTMVGG